MMMRGSFVINKNNSEQTDVVMEIPFDTDVRKIAAHFTDFLVKMGYKLPGFIDLIYYDDLK